MVAVFGLSSFTADETAFTMETGTTEEIVLPYTYQPCNCPTGYSRSKNPISTNPVWRQVEDTPTCYNRHVATYLCTKTGEFDILIACYRCGTP